VADRSMDCCSAPGNSQRERRCLTFIARCCLTFAFASTAEHSKSSLDHEIHGVYRFSIHQKN
jgi:hypothetical protein